MTNVVNGIEYSRWENVNNQSNAKKMTGYYSSPKGGLEKDTCQFSCTDGKDDGKLSFKEKAGCFFTGAANKVKEQVLGVVSSIKEHPIKTAAITAGTIGAAAAATAALGPGVIVALGAAGLGAAVVNGAKAVKSTAESFGDAKKAKTDAEAKQAYSNIGGSTTEVAENVGLAILSATQIKSGLNAMKSSHQLTAAPEQQATKPETKSLPDKTAQSEAIALPDNASEAVALPDNAPEVLALPDKAQIAVDNAPEVLALPDNATEVLALPDKAQIAVDNAARSAGKAAEEILEAGGSKSDYLNAIKQVHPDQWESQQVSEEILRYLSGLTTKLNKARAAAA